MNVVPNENRTDRTIRIGVGVVILAVGAVIGSWWSMVGLIPLFTGLAGWCPVYAMLGCSTVPSERAKFQSGRRRSLIERFPRFMSATKN